MRMAGQREVLRRSAELHGHAGFADHLADARPDHVHAEHLVAAGIGEDLDEAFALVVDLRPAVGAEREASDLVLAPRRLQLLLAEATLALPAGCR